MAPVDCALPTLRVVANAGLTASDTYTLLNYFGPELTAGQGNALDTCTIDRDNSHCIRDNSHCIGFAELAVVEDDGHSIRTGDDATAATTSAIAMSLSFT